jgi:hypothetical protein
MYGNVGSYETENEPLGPIKGGQFLEEQSDYWLLKNDSASWSSIPRLTGILT